MKREDFIKKAVASGKPKDEIRKVYDAIEASGGFDDQVFEQKEPKQAAPVQQEPQRAEPI